MRKFGTDILNLFHKVTYKLWEAKGFCNLSRASYDEPFLAESTWRRSKKAGRTQDPENYDVVLDDPGLFRAIFR